MSILHAVLSVMFHVQGEREGDPHVRIWIQIHLCMFNIGPCHKSVHVIVLYNLKALYTANGSLESLLCFIDVVSVSAKFD